VKVRNSLKSLRNRHRDNRLVRRKGRVYIINKTQKRFKARRSSAVVRSWAGSMRRRGEALRTSPRQT